MSLRKQSQIINNFFTLASIIIIAVTLVLYTTYIVKDPNEKEVVEEPKKLQNLECESDNITSYKIYNQKLLDNSIKALNKGYYKLSGGYIKSQYSKSIIEEYIALEELDSFYKNAIGFKPKKDIKKYLTINYELIEDDKKNPKRKARKGLYSGSIKTSFRANNIEIFSIITDFSLYDKSEIQSRINCSIEVYKNNAR